MGLTRTTPGSFGGVFGYAKGPPLARRPLRYPGEES